MKSNYFGKGEWEAFFGLFGDVFSKVAAIIGILYIAEGFPVEIVMGKMLPGIGFASLIGSLIYFWEAYDVGKKCGRCDVTALPFGISSTQVFAWMFLILVPIYRRTGDATLAWQISLAACLLGGIIEVAGAFVSKVMLKYIPNSALMGNMAAGALVWLAFNGFVTVFQVPMISVIPLFLLIIAFKKKKTFIKNVPNSLLIILVGSVFAWITGYCNLDGVKDSIKYFAFYPPTNCLSDIVKGFKEIGPYLSIIVPLQIANFIGTMQSVESATISGDNYPVKRSMALDGITTILSSLTGSPFPTSVYYGHIGWKKMGARSGYMLLMSFTYITCFLGLPLIILSIVPYEVVIVLLVFVGLTVASEVADNMEKEYSSVIYISLFPILAQYIYNLINDVLKVAGTSITEVSLQAFNEAGLMVSAIQVLSYGAFASSLLYAVWIAYVYRREFNRAGITAFILSVLSAVGFIHSEQMAWFPRMGIEFAGIYIVIGIICLIVAKSEVTYKAKEKSKVMKRSALNKVKSITIDM